MTRPALALALLVALAAAGARADDAVSAEDVATEVVEVVTLDADGSKRETKVWIVSVDGAAYLRTGGTRWFANVERDADLVLRIGEREIPRRALLVSDAGTIERVEQAFRAKYGFSDRMAGLISFGGPRILRLDARD